MSIQEQARVLYKYGKQYPDVFPFALEQASSLYSQDRISRGIE